MAVGVGHQLVGLLAGRIEAHRVVHAVVLRKRQVGVAAIDRAAAGIHQVFDAVVAAALKDVAKAHQIGLDVGRWVLDRVAHPRLGSQIDHPHGPVLGKGRLNRSAVFQVCLDQIKRDTATRSRGLQLGQPRPFKRWVVIGVQIVEAQHRRAPLQQPRAQVKANETGGAGHQHRSLHRL